MRSTTFLTRLASSGALLALATSASAQQFRLSEIVIDVPGTDSTEECLEIRGPANTALTGFFFLTIDGDGTSSGVVDVSQDLSAYSTGANGLLLVRGAATVINPAPDPATNVVVFDWNPDIENGSNTYVLGSGTAPATGTDLDVGDDGALDAPIAGFTVADAVCVLESGTGAENAYADDLGGETIPQMAFTPDALYRIFNGNGTPCSWAGGDLLGTNPGGPYTWDVGTGEVFGGLTGGGVDPGTLNIILDADSDGIADACEGIGPGTAYCAGDGIDPIVTTPCPCGNFGAVGNGCASSFNASGAGITAAGVVANDDVVLTGSGMQASGICVFLQGDAIDPLGFVFGDGVTCTGGALIRLRGVALSGGSASFPVPPETITLSARGGVTVGSGAIRSYTVFYRNAAAAFCPPFTFNTSNSYQITW